MYSQSFYITAPVGNNAFSFDAREDKKLFVPSLKKIEHFSDIHLGNHTAFEDVTLEGELQSFKGLKNFYEMEWKSSPQTLEQIPSTSFVKGGEKKKKIFLFDNHNHAYFFWYLARDRGYIGDNNTLIHIDEHADTRDPGEYLMKPDSFDLDKVFHATNYTYNVGNYIIPAQKEGIISDIIQVRSEFELEQYLSSPPPKDNLRKNIILNLDLDFFQPDLDFIDYEMKKQVVLDAAQKANVITIATSPFFIEQSLAIKVLKDIFG